MTAALTVSIFAASAAGPLSEEQIEAIADLFNALNNNATTGEVQTVGSSLGRRSEIIEGRLLRLGVQIKF